MEDRFLNTHTTLEERNLARRALLACGLWIRLGFVGASAFAIGVLQSFDATARPLTALVLIVGGGVLAVSSWRRAGSVLDKVDRANAVAASAPLPNSACPASPT